MMSEESRFTIYLEHVENYAFNVKFDWDTAGTLAMDEPPPLGNQDGPNASRLLTAAIANCLSASLLFCIAKNKVNKASLRAEGACQLIRNEKGRLRIGGVSVRITLSDNIAQAASAARCMALFEDFCVVTQSIRQGIAVEVEVVDDSGDVLHHAK
jgi:organic hydroperoxide reductase OsmC/OhrA